MATDTTDSQSESQRKSVSYNTYLKWKRELEKECKTLTWLDCETSGTGGRKTVDKLKCKVCIQFKSTIDGRRNFSEKWISGATSLKTSNIKDHSRSDQHKHAMVLFHKAQDQCSSDSSSTSSTPIAKALYHISETDRKTLNVKFDIAHFISTQKIAFTNYPVLCQLEEKHGVQVGAAYRNQEAGKTFCHFIAQTKRNDLLQSIAKARYFSILMDSSTDTANIDEEMFLVLWCDIHCEDQLVHTNMSYFSIARPNKTDAEGLYECLENSLRRLGIQSISSEYCKMMIGLGTDGASANIAARGLKGLVEKEISWIHWSWCLAHRAELAVKDALKGTTFDLIDEMLLRLYYIYEKSPKKCRELAEIISDLKQYIQFDSGGTKPLRASGSRWVSHKLSAMKRVLSKFGAYSSHLIALSEDSTLRSSDKAKLRGYSTKWTNAKYILGCAFFCDLLSPCATFSKVLQYDHLDILGAFTSLLRTMQELQKLSSKSLQHWVHYSTTLTAIEDDTYQQQKLTHVSEAKRYFTSNYEKYCDSVTTCLKTRLEWTDLQFVKDVIMFLATQGWQKLVDEKLDQSQNLTYILAINRLTLKFKIPLEHSGAVITNIVDEFCDMIEYATQFISLSSSTYQAVWWKLFHSPNSSDWINVLKLARILFTLPVSNGKLERVFSTMKTLKVERRSSMSNELLDDLLILNVDKVEVKDFQADSSIDLWWKSKSRRPNQKKRKDYKRRKVDLNVEISEDDDNSESDADILSDWDEYFQSY